MLHNIRLRAREFPFPYLLGLPLSLSVIYAGLKILTHGRTSLAWVFDQAFGLQLPIPFDPFAVAGLLIWAACLIPVVEGVVDTLRGREDPTPVTEARLVQARERVEAAVGRATLLLGEPRRDRDHMVLMLRERGEHAAADELLTAIDEWQRLVSRAG